MCTLWHRFCRKFWLLIDEIALLTDMHGETDNICASALVLSRFVCIAVAFVQFMFVVHVFVSCYHP